MQLYILFLIVQFKHSPADCGQKPIIKAICPKAQWQRGKVEVITEGQITEYENHESAEMVF